MEVEAIAQGNAWQLQKSDVFSHAWNVEIEGLTLYFCREVFRSLDQVNDGTLVDFVDTVFHLEMRFGLPNTSVTILSPRSQWEMHSIQSVFETEIGTRISVQLNSRDDRQTVSRASLITRYVKKNNDAVRHLLLWALCRPRRMRNIGDHLGQPHEGSALILP